MSDTYNNAPAYATRINPAFRQFTREQWRRLLHLASLPSCPPEKRQFLLRVYRQSNQS